MAGSGSAGLPERLLLLGPCAEAIQDSALVVEVDLCHARGEPVFVWPGALEVLVAVEGLREEPAHELPVLVVRSLETRHFEGLPVPSLAVQLRVQRLALHPRLGLEQAVVGPEELRHELAVHLPRA